MKKLISYEVPIAIWEPMMKLPPGVEYMRLGFEVTSEEEYQSHIAKRDNVALGIKNFTEEDLPTIPPEPSEIDRLRADLIYMSIMTGVDLNV